MSPNLPNEHNGERRLLVAKFSRLLKWESLKVLQIQKLKQTKQSWRGDCHTGLQELTHVMRTISPTTETVRTSVPDEPQLIVQDHAGLACCELHLWLLLAEAEAAFLHL